jgi:hypothetical protein
VFDDVERSYEIECAIFVRQFFAGAKAYLVEPALATESKCIFGDVDAICVAVFLKQEQVRPCSATDVENSRASIGYTPANVFDKRGNDLAASGVPPMRLLHAKEDRIRVLHHLARKWVSDGFYL